MTESTSITVTKWAANWTASVTINDKTWAWKLYVCNSAAVSDVAWNSLWASQVRSENMYLDNTAPTLSVSIVSSEDGLLYQKQHTARVVLSDSHSKLAAWTYTIRYNWSTSAINVCNATAMPYTTTITVSAWDSSKSADITIKDKTWPWKLYVCNSTAAASDRVWNSLAAGQVKSVNMYLDNTPPTVSLTRQYSAAKKQYVIVRQVCYDATSSMTWYYFWTTYMTYGLPKAYDPWLWTTSWWVDQFIDNPWTYYLSCSDEADNIATKSLTVLQYNVYNMWDKDTWTVWQYNNNNYEFQWLISNHKFTYLIGKGLSVKPSELYTKPREQGFTYKWYNKAAPSASNATLITNDNAFTIDTNNSNYTFWFNRNVYTWILKRWSWIQSLYYNDGSYTTYTSAETVTLNMKYLQTLPYMDAEVKAGYEWYKWCIDGKTSGEQGCLGFDEQKLENDVAWIDDRQYAAVARPKCIKITLSAPGANPATQYIYYKYWTAKYYSDAACTNQITKVTTLPSKGGVSSFGWYWQDSKQWIAWDGNFHSDNILATTYTSDKTLVARYGCTSSVWNAFDWSSISSCGPEQKPYRTGSGNGYTTRTSKCNNGEWDVAPYNYTTCYKWCQWVWAPYRHDMTVEAFSVQYSANCANNKATLTCNNGSRTPSGYNYYSCQEPTCGSAASTSSATPPSSNLCSNGTAWPVSIRNVSGCGSPKWKWSCLLWGVRKSCSATVSPVNKVSVYQSQSNQIYIWLSGTVTAHLVDGSTQTYGLGHQHPWANTGYIAFTKNVAWIEKIVFDPLVSSNKRNVANGSSSLLSWDYACGFSTGWCDCNKDWHINVADRDYHTQYGCDANGDWYVNVADGDYLLQHCSI